MLIDAVVNVVAETEEDNKRVLDAIDLLKVDFVSTTKVGSVHYSFKFDDLGNTGVKYLIDEFGEKE